MPTNKQALTLAKMYFIWGSEQRPKAILPKDIVELTLQYAQYEELTKIVKDLDSLLSRDCLNFVSQSELLRGDETLVKALSMLKNWDSLPISNTFMAYQQYIAPLIQFIATAPLFDEGDLATPLMMTAFYGHTEAMKVMLAVPDIEVNQAERYHGRTALMFAAEQGHTEAVRLLLSVPDIEVNKYWNDGSVDYFNTFWLHPNTKNYAEIAGLITQYLENQEALAKASISGAKRTYGAI